MNLSINDFRNIVGQYSLGYVDFKTDANGEAVGLKKVSNHKTLTFLNASEANVSRTLGGQKAVNMRETFANTIRASFGNQIPAARLEEILNGLLNDNDHAKSTPLARREIRQVFASLDSAVTAELARIEDAARARVGKTVDLVRSQGNEAEKANLEAYNDAILTPANVRQLHSRIRAALPNAAKATVEKITTNLMAHFAEIALRQAVKGQTPDSFARFLEIYAANDEQVSCYDFTLTPAQLEQAKGLAKNWLVDTLKHDVDKHRFHDKTNVHGLSLREYKPNSVKINGQPVPSTCSDAVLSDGGKEIVRADLASEGGTGASGISSEEKCAFHETLIRTFPDPKTRGLVSMLLSMANGAKGFFGDTFDACDKVNLLGNIPKWVMLMTTLKANDAGFTSKQMNGDSEAKGVYQITVSPETGKVTIDMTSAEGVTVVAGKIQNLALDGENKQDFTLTVSRQKYHTVITIDPSVRDENGYPDFSIDTMEMAD